MSHILQISQSDPVIHLKAYGGLKIEGVQQDQVQCEIDAPQLATLMEEDGHVYLTANSSCSVTVPVDSSIQIEKGMGSVSIKNIRGDITIEKVMGNLVLTQVGSAHLERTGGNCAVRDSSGEILLEKVGGNLVVDKVASLRCEKVGGVCLIKDVTGDVSVEKVGGNFKAEEVAGLTYVGRVGADFRALDLTINEDIVAGGNIRLARLNLSDDVDLRAGGDVILSLVDTLPGAKLVMRSGGHRIRITHQNDDIEIKAKEYEYAFGDEAYNIDISAGGKILIGEEIGSEAKGIEVGDLSSYFSYEENTLNEMVQERIEAATRRAEAKVKAAEIRLGQIRENVEKNRKIKIDIDLDDLKAVKSVTPVPPVTRKAGKKGASDEERLMILKMLQDKMISVDEAESLFKALEN
ncbi:hypothetical protein JR338_04375 [Chloroflexota bacterium]|nr:hypothetical protein JR338_04375 [Chloroflexota bacterium]